MLKVSKQPCCLIILSAFLILATHSQYARSASNDNSVTNAQRYLQYIGFSNIVDDGIFGAKTRIAVKRVMQASGYPEHSGTLDNDAVNVLRVLSNRKYHYLDWKKNHFRKEYALGNQASSAIRKYNGSPLIFELGDGQKLALQFDYKGERKYTPDSYEEFKKYPYGIPWGDVYGALVVDGKKLNFEKYGRWEARPHRVKTTPSLLCIYNDKNKTCYKGKNLFKKEVHTIFHFELFVAQKFERHLNEWRPVVTSNRNSYFGKYTGERLKNNRQQINEIYRKYETKKRSQQLLLLGIATLLSGGGNNTGDRSNSGCSRGQVRDSVNGGFCPGMAPIPGVDY